MTYQDTKYRRLHCDCVVVEKLGRLFGRKHTYDVNLAHSEHELVIPKGVFRPKSPPAGSWVTVHNLQSLSDGGILDPDDKLNDVADDREQIIAIYEENGTLPHLSDNGGGTSASSMGTDSPEMFHSEDVTSDASTGQPECHTDVEIIGDCVPLGISTLQVRRGSEPALNRLSPAPNIYVDPMKRWSTAVAIGDKNQRCSELDNEKLEERSDAEIHSDREDENGYEKSAFIPFSREAGRISILGNNMEMNRWADAADRQVYRLLDSRREPLGAPNLINNHSSNHDRNQLVVLKNDGRSLGIHVVPECDENGRAQEIFKDAILEREISLRLSKMNGGYRPPAPVYPHRRLESSKSDADVEHEKADQHDKGLGNTQTYPPAGQRSAIAVMSANTRRMGKKYQIKLTKGPSGLGFSITTRDNVAGGNCPFYIKKILPVGAAIDDGRLQPGDRLLEVNGVELTGKTQDAAVGLLRNAPAGSEVHLTVSRQEHVENSPKLPRAIISTDSYNDRHENLFTPTASSLRFLPPEKISDDSLTFPWKQRESFTFDIPLNDTGSAGLGVSVKGKTSTGPNGTSDLGIFVKSVIRGGAAYKDGRLRENDQLININGVSLLKMPNSQAMETLRRVMHQEGPRPGAITLTVTRRIQMSSYNSTSLSNAQNASTDFSSSDKSQTPTSDVSTTDSDRTAVYCPYRSKNSNDDDHNLNQGNFTKIEDKDLGLDCLPTSRNPVVERITGQKMPRNDSFYQACHDNYNQVKKYVNGTHSHLQNNRPTHFGMMSPTITACQDESVMIENEYISSSKASSQKARSSRSATPENLLAESKQSLNSENNKPIGDSNVSYVSQMSLDESEVPGFERAGFGRQSMSEKRNAQLDAKNTDTWQRNKRAREARDRTKDEPSSLTRKNLGADGAYSNLVRCNSADSIMSAVRTANITNGHSRDRPMKRSNSLESVSKEEEIYGRGTGSRGRVCNESFRAAVDRSYDAPGSTNENMETLDEESESGSSNLVGRIASSGIEGSGEDLGVNVKDSSGNAINKAKKKGLLKNLGSVFKFGKNKKDPSSSNLKSHPEIEPHYTKVDPEMIFIRKSPDDENKEKYEAHCDKKTGPRIDEEKVAQQQQQPSAVNNNVSNSNLFNNANSAWQSRDDAIPNGSRYGHIRAQHQKRHQERQCVYPQDDKEERLQLQAQKQVDRKVGYG
ncbi:hypothetical protein CHUAL_013280 [Chamberlinius hualienensis]